MVSPLRLFVAKVVKVLSSLQCLGCQLISVLGVALSSDRIHHIILVCDSVVQQFTVYWCHPLVRLSKANRMHKWYHIMLLY